MIKTSSVLIVTVVVTISQPFSYAQNQPEQIDANVTNLSFSQTAAGDSIIDLLLVKQETSSRKRGIILHFCDTLLQKRLDTDGKQVKSFYYDEREYRYDPRQSMFMYALCTNIDEVSKGRTIVGEKHISRNYKNDLFESVGYPGSRPVNMSNFWSENIDFNRVWGIPSQSRLDAESAFTKCNPATTMQGCQFSEFLPVMFKNILNEYSNMKLASIYGYKYDYSEDPEKIRRSISEFSTSYFNDPTQPLSPCNEKGLDYITDKDLEGDKKHCSHPETFKELEETIKSAERIVKKNDFVDVKNILDSTCDTNTPKNTLHACSMSNYGDSGFASDRQSYYNLYLNELMWYNLFVDYYSNRILTNTAYNPLTFGSISTSYNRNQKEAKTLQYEKQIAQQATFQTMRMLQNIATTFPVYIGLKAYHEDLVNYRNQLTKSYTPMHQLYYKFRNVQECKE